MKSKTTERLMDDYFKRDYPDTFEEMVQMIKNDVDATEELISHIDMKSKIEDYERAMNFVIKNR